MKENLQKKAWQDRLPNDIELHLKVGAQIIFIKNDSGKRWLNGSMGKVLELGSDYIKVEVFTDEGSFKYEILKETWEITRYKFDFNSFTIKSDIVGKFTQYPIKLGWAITIHKSQGASMDRVHIDFGRGAFAPGQAYVALSRCKSLEGITLERPIMLADIKSDNSVIRFMNSKFPNNNLDKKFSNNARFNEETLKYGTSSNPRDWYVEDDVKMIVPLLHNKKIGIDIRKYRGICKVYIAGNYHWESDIRDDLSMQALWNVIHSNNNVSVEPLGSFTPIQLK